MIVVVDEYGADKWVKPEKDLAVTIPANLELPVASASSLLPTIIFSLLASMVIPAPTCMISELGSKVIVWVPIVKIPVILALPVTSRAKPDFAVVPIPIFLVVWIPTESTTQSSSLTAPINFLVDDSYLRNLPSTNAVSLSTSSKNSRRTSPPPPCS